MLQIQKDHVGLTGSHMFMMTRRFLLTVSEVNFVWSVLRITIRVCKLLYIVLDVRHDCFVRNTASTNERIQYPKKYLRIQRHP